MLAQCLPALPLNGVIPTAEVACLPACECVQGYHPGSKDADSLRTEAEQSLHGEG